jgi:hypothetical protein
LTALYLRLPRFLPELPIAKGDGRYGKLLTTLAKIDVLILDDWGLAPFSEENRRDLLEIVEDRHDRRATIITSQLPVEHWHDALGDPTLADAILDRLVHNAYKAILVTVSFTYMRSAADCVWRAIPRAAEIAGWRNGRDTRPPTCMTTDCFYLLCLLIRTSCQLRGSFLTCWSEDQECRVASR